MVSRTTQTKKLVTTLFQQSRVPLTLLQAYSMARKKMPSIAFSTVYRITQQLKRDKKLVSVDFRDRSGKLEWAERKHHHHVTCNSCGDVADIDDGILSLKLEKVRSKTGFTIQDHVIELSGMCPPCQAKL